MDPFLDEHGILQVGGRLRRSLLDVNLKHPVLLPRDGFVTNLIIKVCHERVHHAGRGMTLNEVRNSGFWVLHGSSAVRKLISQCVLCCLLRGKSGEQKMSDLPSDRMQEAPPFTYCSVDYFSPFYIKDKRKEIKRYGSSFTCLASRAVHIEVADSLDTDSFIMALRRFINLRGNISELRYD